MQTQIADLIKTIKQKMQQVQALNEALQKENAALKNKLDAATTEQSELVTKLNKLQQEVQALQLTQSSMEDESRKALNKAIDKHIAAITKSITLLSE